jgi:hypothetical protein
MPQNASDASQGSGWQTRSRWNLCSAERSDYDAIFSISARHHMPLPEALPVLAAALRPGWVLASIALPRLDVRRELPAEAVAAVGHRLLGAMSFTRRLLGTNSGFAQASERATMPVVMDPPPTIREVARQATHGDFLTATDTCSGPSPERAAEVAAEKFFR